MSSGKRPARPSDADPPKKPNLGAHASRLGLANLRRIPFSDSPDDRTNRVYERNGVGLFTDGQNKWVVPLADDQRSGTSSVSSATSLSSQRSAVIDVVTLSDDDSDTESSAANATPTEHLERRTSSPEMARRPLCKMRGIKTGRRVRPPSHSPLRSQIHVIDIEDSDGESSEDDETKKKIEYTSKRGRRIYHRADLKYQKAALLAQIKVLEERIASPD